MHQDFDASLSDDPQTDHRKIFPQPLKTSPGPSNQCFYFVM